MPISGKVYEALNSMEDSGSSEGNAIADCLCTISENDDEDQPITDEELITSAEELIGWAQFFIKAVRP